MCGSCATQITITAVVVNGSKVPVHVFQAINISVNEAAELQRMWGSAQVECE